MGDLIYSRYIPNAQGGFDRQTVIPVKPASEPVESICEPLPVSEPKPSPCPRRKPELTDLLRHCIRRKLDTGDLLIILILFLLLTEQESDTMTMGLTLAFFLFL